MSAYPFLTWVGGKTKLLPQLRAMYPKQLLQGKIKHYYEPFLGGGAVFFDVVQNYKVASCHLSDNNPELILIYSVIQRDLPSLIECLKEMQAQYNGLSDIEEQETYYLNLREVYNNARLEDVIRAAQMLCLNKTCFNGLFRVNASGGFNNTFGKHKKITLLDEGNLIQVAELLRDVDLKVADFEGLGVKEDSFIYLDPPYRKVKQASNFNSYGKIKFSDQDQIRVANKFNRLHDMGAKVMLSNSDPKQFDAGDTFFDCYYEGFNIARVATTRAISGDKAFRGNTTELVITNYERI